MSRNKKKKHHKKHYVVTPYITTPIIFLLVSMVVVVPMLFVGMNFAIKTVHTAQKSLTIDYNDYKSVDSNSAYGEIRCNQIGLKANIYSGINRVTLRDGCGMYYNDNGAIMIAGYSSGVFKVLPKIQIDNIIVIKTDEGEKMYRVIDISDKFDKNTKSKTIVLCTTKSSEPFAYFAKQNIYVMAEEVQYE